MKDNASSTVERYRVLRRVARPPIAPPRWASPPHKGRHVGRFRASTHRRPAARRAAADVTTTQGRRHVIHRREVPRAQHVAPPPPAAALGQLHRNPSRSDTPPACRAPRHSGRPPPPTDDVERYRVLAASLGHRSPRRGGCRRRYPWRSRRGGEQPVSGRSRPKRSNEHSTPVKDRCPRSESNRHEQLF
jgi:hypothetical protein